MFLRRCQLLLTTASPITTSVPTPLEPPCSPSFDNDNLKIAFQGYLKQGHCTNTACAIIAKHGDIEEWCTSEVTNMHALFYHTTGDPVESEAKALNKNLATWNVGKVTDMGFMFALAAAFKQNLCSWGNAALFPYDGNGAAQMFLGSGCKYKESPKHGWYQWSILCVFDNGNVISCYQ